MPEYEKRLEMFYQMDSEHSKLVKEKDDLKNTFDIEKKAIETKINSTTQLKNTIIKNSKVSNKITNLESINTNKKEMYENNIKSSQDKLYIQKKEIRDRYDAKKEQLENKMNIELQEAETRSKQTVDYYTQQIVLLNTKSDTVIRDLSSNIIELSPFTEIDEDNHPRLIKLKELIVLKEKEIDNAVKNKQILWNIYVDEKNKHEAYLKCERESEERDIQNKENIRLAQLKQVKEEEKRAEAERDRKRWEEQDKQALQAEKDKLKKEQQTINFKTIKSELSKEYKYYVDKLIESQKVEIIKLKTSGEVIKYIDAIKDQLDKHIYLDTLDESKHFKPEIWEKYYALLESERYEIAQKSKSVQIKLINQYYDKFIESNKEESSEDDNEDE
jgi:hypothetical protein